MQLTDDSKSWCLHFTKLQFLKNLSALVHFDNSFSIAWLFDINIKLLKTIHQKMKSLKICYITNSKLKNW